jgi:predicted transcriptional regulator
LELASGEEQEHRILSDSDIIVRMLYFCEIPKQKAQIMSYCGIDAERFRQFSEHCLRRGILKIAFVDQGLEAMVITSRGKEVLATAKDIIKTLGLDFEPDAELR